MKEKINFTKDNLSFLKSDEREFIEAAVTVMEQQLFKTSPQAEHYEDLKQNIDQFRNLNKYDHRFIRNNENKVIGIQIIDAKED